MGKAEKYLQENTKALKESNGKEYFKWLTLDQALRAVEIEREEMIKKACNFVAERLFFNGNMLYTNIQSKIVEDIKQAMKKDE